MSQHSWGSTLEYSADGTTWTELTEIKDMGFDGVDRTMVNGNYLNMASYRMIKRPGLEDGGTFSFNAHVSTGVVAEIRALADVDPCEADAWYFRVTNGCDGETDEFRGWLSSFGKTFPEDDNIMLPCKITLSETWSFAN